MNFEDVLALSDDRAMSILCDPTTGWVGQKRVTRAAPGLRNLAWALVADRIDPKNHQFPGSELRVVCTCFGISALRWAVRQPLFYVDDGTLFCRPLKPGQDNLAICLIPGHIATRALLDTLGEARALFEQVRPGLYALDDRHLEQYLTFFRPEEEA